VPDGNCVLAVELHQSRRRSFLRESAMPDGFRSVSEVAENRRNLVREKNISNNKSHQRGELPARKKNREDNGTVIGPVLTAKIKTDAIWARIIRNCLLSLAARARARGFHRVHTSQGPIIRCSKGGKT